MEHFGLNYYLRIGEYLVNNFYLLILKSVECLRYATNSSPPKTGNMRSLNRGVDCSNGAEFRIAETPISLSARRVLFLSFSQGHP
jgi:hypothetical protein